MINLNSDTGISRLFSAINTHREAKKPFTANRNKMIQQYVGTLYDKHDVRKRAVLANLMNMTAEVATVALAAQCPQVKITTDFLDLWAFAHKWQFSLNNLLKEIHFAETLQNIILDSWFTLGIAKVFQKSTGSVQLYDDVWADPGRPYIDRISWDDFGLDMAVKDVRKCKFMWDEYRVPWEEVQGNPHFSQAAVRQLAPTSKYDRDEEKAADITAGLISDHDDLGPMIDLMDVWLPETQQTAIFSKHVETEPLLIIDEGPEGGPYRLLRMGNVPDNAMPTTPGQQLYHLHILFNQLARKQASQALRHKVNPTYRPGAAKDAERLKKFNDGDWVKVNDPKAVNVVTQGGVDQGSVAFSLGIMELFDRQAGNLPARAGLGVQAPTASQEQLLDEKLSRQEAHIQQKVHNFTVDLLTPFSSLMWHDKVLSVPAQYELAPGTGFYMPANWTPEEREGDWYQYNFDIKPHSMNYEPPSVQLMKVERMMEKAVMLQPLVEAAGGHIDVQEMFRMYADAENIPELRTLIRFNQPSTVQRPGPAGQPSHMPAHTTRDYVRHNVSTGGTPQARTGALQQAMLKSGNQNQGSLAGMSQ